MIDNKELVKGSTFSRFSYSGKRYYYNDKAPLLATSVTTILSDVLPEGYAVKKLISEMGLSGFNKFMHERACYGTAMHTLVNQYLESADTPEQRHLSVDAIERHLRVIIPEARLDVSLDNWKYDLTRDLLAIVQFFRDHKVQPIMIEPVVASNSLGLYYAGAIDLVCTMAVQVKGYFGEVYKSGDRKGQPKETNDVQLVTAIVDYKSGKNGFRASHEAQLAMYKHALCETKPEFKKKFIRLFNLSPKDWTGDTPTYTLKDQTVSPFNDTETLKALLLLYKVVQPVKEPEVQIFTDTINGSDPAECFTKMPLSDYIFNKKGAML